MAKYLILILICVKGWGQGNLDKSINQPAFHIKYSSDWKLDETGRHGSEFFLSHTPVSGKFGNNINLMIQNIESLNLNLQTYTELSEKQIKANGKLINSQRKFANDIEFQEIMFEASFNGYDNKFIQYYFIKDNKAYVLTFTATKSEFDGLLEEAIKIMNSFRIK